MNADVVKIEGVSCGCGDPEAPGVVHRSDGPCYIDDAPEPDTTDDERLLLSWTDERLDAAIAGARRTLAGLGVVRMEIDPIEGPRIAALVDLLVDAGVIDRAALEHRTRVRWLLELDRGVREVQREKLAGRSGDTRGPGIAIPRKA